MIYTNLDKLHLEVGIEPYVHRSVLTLWANISFIKKEELKRIPENFHKAADYVRARFQKEKVDNDVDAKHLLWSILRDPSARLFKILGGESSKDRKQKEAARKRALTKKRIQKLGFRSRDLRIALSDLDEYYQRNTKFPLRLNASELTDMIAFDPICGYSKTIMDLVEKHSNIEINLRTKTCQRERANSA